MADTQDLGTARITIVAGTTQAVAGIATSKAAIRDLASTASQQFSAMSRGCNGHTARMSGESNE